MYQLKIGKRSIGSNLREKYFGSTSDVTFSSYYKNCVQSDSNTCGAWLIAGIVAYILGTEVHNNLLDRERVFDAMMILVENLDFAEKCEKLAKCLNTKCSPPAKRKVEKLGKDFDFDLTRVKVKAKKQYVINDSSDDENLPIEPNKTSTPRKIAKYPVNSSTLSSLSEFSNKEIPDISVSSHMGEPSDSELSNDSSNSNSVSSGDVGTFDGNYSSDYVHVESYVGSENCDIDDHSNSIIGDQAIGGYPIPDNKFLSADDIFNLLINVGNKNTVESIPDGRKENVYFVFSESKNIQRSSVGKHKQYPDDCGAWDKGRIVKSHFIIVNDVMKSLSLKDGFFCIEKQISGLRVYEKVEPQPKTVYTLSRYYTVLKCCNAYKRRISRLQLSNDEKNNVFSIVEYIGEYPNDIASHGNAKHQDTMYTRTKPEVLEKVASLTKGRTPRDVYKSMVLENSFDAPKDFKQVRNVKYNLLKKHDSGSDGKKNNLADEVLECLLMVDSCEFVQQFCKSKGKMPNFVCYTEDQKEDLMFFLSRKRDYPIGVDRTFNLGHFFVTALVYKNLRVVRKDNEDEHPLFVGPIFIHRDATFESYNFFFHYQKQSLLKKFNELL